MHGKSSSEDIIAIKAKVEAIPGAMRRMGWGVAGELMERWIHSPAWVLPIDWKKEQPLDLSVSHLDQQIVRMGWAMSNPRVRVAMNKLRVNMINGPARKLLHDRLDEGTWGGSHRIEFGNQRNSALQLDRTCQSNFEPLGGDMDTMDDVYGGLGKATLKAALIGHASRDVRTGKIALQVTHAGFYIRDTYDFNDFQYLGTWTTNGVLSKTAMLMNTALDGMVSRWKGEPIGNLFNHDFDTYRRLTGFGGDFVLYSDVHWEPMNLLLALS